MAIVRIVIEGVGVWLILLVIIISAIGYIYSLIKWAFKM